MGVVVIDGGLAGGMQLEPSEGLVLQRALLYKTSM